MWGTPAKRATTHHSRRFIPTHVGNTDTKAARAGGLTVHPHACGEHARLLRQQHPCPRFIPTHVGNTGPVRAPTSKQAVHPHACGEHELCASIVEGGFGSSPRMWGTRLKSSDAASSSPVHPHACGEHARRFTRISRAFGSSPRMWGTQLEVNGLEWHVRFIPTHVGNTKMQMRSMVVSPVHPHACGEHGRITECGSGAMRFIPTHVGNTNARRRASLAASVHPHACGEHAGGSPLTQYTFGSSPRMWGTRKPDFPVRHRRRFIPTHVGNTRAPAATNRCSSVHPHACGEHFQQRSQVRNLVGSSPRMWGTHTNLMYHRKARRFIPTHVGNTRRPVLPSRHRSVHPHACGEHWRDDETPWCGVGSSPRMWGTLAARHRGGFCNRFIPTHVGNTPPANPLTKDGGGSSPRMWGTPGQPVAGHHEGRFIPTHVGNTASGSVSMLMSPVHPHARGEHIEQFRLGFPNTGSSPRMWGTPELKRRAVNFNRFIPTHVGNTPRRLRPRLKGAVHPHACGEHAVTRGRVAVAVRFIPTHVGNTRPCFRLAFGLSVHPHACGEHPTSARPPTPWTGSSPRMWGTPLRGRWIDSWGRFIPTTVGNTHRTPATALPRSVHPHACGEHA